VAVCGAYDTSGHPAARAFFAVSKTSCLPPRIKLVGKGHHTMSEQEKPKSFMQELDQWTEANVIEPLIDSEQEFNAGETLEDTITRVKKAIRAKMLESYRNGQQAGPRVAKAPQRGGR